MDKCKLCFAHNNMKALCGTFINSWAILRFNELVVCFKHNIHDGGCNYMFNNVFHGVWCVNEFKYHSKHLHFIYNHILPMMGLRYLWNLDFVGLLSLAIQYNWYVLVMIKHLFKWLMLVPLLNHNNEGTTYAFMDNMFNRFGILVEIFINQSMEFHEKFQKLHEKILIDHHMTS